MIAKLLAFFQLVGVGVNINSGDYSLAFLWFCGLLFIFYLDIIEAINNLKE